eukprot:scaffold17818_cov15-Prasinocladus_malaysianus.AAC.1
MRTVQQLLWLIEVGYRSGEHTDERRFAVWAKGKDSLFVDTKLLVRESFQDSSQPSDTGDQRPRSRL